MKPQHLMEKNKLGDNKRPQKILKILEFLSCLIQMQNKHRLIPITRALTLPAQQTAQAPAEPSFPLLLTDGSPPPVCPFNSFVC